jgi:hypothetical protein
VVSFLQVYYFVVISDALRLEKIFAADDIVGFAQCGCRDGRVGVDTA